MKTARFCALAALLAACDDAPSASDAHVVDAASSKPDAAVSDATSSEPDARVADASSVTACVWGVNALLAEVNVTSSERTYCGTFNSAQVQQVSLALNCLLSIPRGQGGELIVNYCIDCSIPSTYVLTPTGELFHVRMEEDLFGDDQRSATVARCKNLVNHGESGIECVDATLLYSCQMRFR
jgi:hypothetical protein